MDTGRGVMDMGRGVTNTSRRVVNASRQHDDQQPSSAPPQAAILRLRPLDIVGDCDDAPDEFKDSYIYGTNYQFCHGYIGKNLSGMTQEKTVQAMGRVGRNSLQQNYTIRFRDDGLIKKLFTSVPANDKLEVINMNRLFTSVRDSDN